MAGGLSWPRRSDGLTFCGWLRLSWAGGGFFIVVAEGSILQSDEPFFLFHWGMESSGEKGKSEVLAPSCVPSCAGVWGRGGGFRARPLTPPRRVATMPPV